MGLNYLDLFSGIGGFALGIRQALADKNSGQPEQWTRSGECTRPDGHSTDLQGKPRQDNEDSNPQSTTEKPGQAITKEESGKRGEWSLDETGRNDLSSGHRELSSIGNHYFSEIDKYAIQIYKRHFPEAIGLGSIVDIDPDKLGRIDLITFGFPCQDLSIAGKRAGLQGRRSGLFFEATRLIRALRPSIFIFENVKGLLSSNDGEDFEAVLREIADIGIYECEWQLVNTAWVLPQNRERIYFIGHLGEGSGQKVFPIREGSIGVDEQEGNARAERERFRGNDIIIPTITQRYYKDGAEALIKIGHINSDSQGQRVYSPEGNSAQLTSQGGGWGAKTGLYEVKAVLTPDRMEKRQNGRRMKEDGEPSFSLTGQDKHGVAIGSSIRRLTPTECCRLQGFPDDWCDGISDSQKYKCLGNAVSVPIVKMIAERLFKE
ncbi:MAG: DNA (cytosine-5-)-methyltransferase [Candidatus Izemoplasmatales bacterium]